MKKVFLLFLWIPILNSAFPGKLNALTDTAKDNNAEQVLCVQKNSSFSINVFYEFKSNTALKHEQKVLEYKLYIDNGGYITIPPFFEYIENATISGEGEQQLRHFTATKNRIRIIDNDNCNSTCITYSDLAARITKEYSDRIGNIGIVQNIVVTIIPEDFFYSVIVIYKEKKYLLPYSGIPINEYFSEELTRRTIGYRKKRFKVEVFRRCNKTHTDRKREARFKVNYRYNPGWFSLEVGDIVYIK